MARILVTGGAGFPGVISASHFATDFDVNDHGNPTLLEAARELGGAAA